MHNSMLFIWLQAAWSTGILAFMQENNNKYGISSFNRYRTIQNIQSSPEHGYEKKLVITKRDTQELTSSQFRHRRSSRGYQREGSKESEGLLRAKQIQAKELKTNNLRARRIKADRIKSDTIISDTILVQSNRKKPNTDLRDFQQELTKAVSKRAKKSNNQNAQPIDQYYRLAKVDLNSNQPLDNFKGEPIYGAVSVSPARRTSRRRPKQEAPVSISDQLISSTSDNLKGSNFLHDRRKFTRRHPKYRQGDRSVKLRNSFINQSNSQPSFDQSSSQGLLKAKELMANTINTHSMKADRVNADFIESKTVKTKQLRVQPKHFAEMSFYTHPESDLHHHLIKHSQIRGNKENGSSTSVKVNRFRKKHTNNAAKTFKQHRTGYDKEPYFNEKITRLEQVRGSSSDYLQARPQEAEIVPTFGSLGISRKKHFSPDHQMYIQDPVIKSRLNEIRNKQIYTSRPASNSKLPYILTDISSSTTHSTATNPTEYISDSYTSFQKLAQSFNEGFMF